MNSKEYSISAGGSLFFDKNKEISSSFITKISDFFKNFSDRGYRFHIICGGGPLARLYIDGARQAGVTDTQMLDLLGISMTHINARLLYTALRARDQKVTYNHNPYLEEDSIISISGGFGVGHTTDYVAVKIAIMFGLDKIINLTNVEGIYPQIEGNLDKSRIISEMAWSNFISMKQETHTPGINTPFDPEAAQLAQENNITAIILNGHNLLNFSNYLIGNKFIGTIITPF